MYRGREFRVCDQKLNGKFATLRYSSFWNLYLSVERNLGLTSRANCLRSSIAPFRSFSLYPVHFSISLFHALIFLKLLALKMNAAAAISEVLCFKKKASRRDISARYWAKKNICSSEAVFDSLRYRWRKRRSEGTKKLKSRDVRMSNSSWRTSSFVNLFSETLSRSFSSGG